MRRQPSGAKHANPKSFRCIRRSVTGRARGSLPRPVAANSALAADRSGLARNEHERRADGRASSLRCPRQRRHERLAQPAFATDQRQRRQQPAFPWPLSHRFLVAEDSKPRFQRATSKQSGSVQNRTAATHRKSARRLASARRRSARRGWGHATRSRDSPKLAAASRRRVAALRTTCDWFHGRFILVAGKLFGWLGRVGSHGFGVGCRHRSRRRQAGPIGCAYGKGHHGLLVPVILAAACAELCTTISTRRLLARPSGVVLSAMG